jgi:hypothetical protein
MVLYLVRLLWFNHCWFGEILMAHQEREAFTTKTHHHYESAVKINNFEINFHLVNTDTRLIIIIRYFIKT